MGNTISQPTLEDVHSLPIQPPDFCPDISPTVTFSESEKEKHAENMSDTELVVHLERTLRPVGETVRHIIPYLREARARFAHPGRRVPIEGQPSYTEWIHQTLGISDRHVRRLLAATKEPTDRRHEDELEQNPKQQKRDEVMWQACRMAHAVLGLDELDEGDLSGRQRKAALAAMAHQFLHGVHRKPVAVIVRTKPLQPTDINGLCRVILTCFEMQFDEVFASLGAEERREALRMFTQQFAERYDGPGSPIAIIRQ